LKLLLDHEQDMRVVGETGDFVEALELVGARHPAVLVLDLRMSDGSVAERVQRLRDRAPGTKVVIVTMHENRLYADQVLEAGAMGFVRKDRADVELCDGIRCAAGGVKYISPRLAGP
jgi:DNA-binding NarL/FixJ family response regulator